MWICGWHDCTYQLIIIKEKTTCLPFITWLKPRVPKNLKGSVHPFEYNDFDELNNIVNNNDIGVKMSCQKLWSKNEF